MAGSRQCALNSHMVGMTFSASARCLCTAGKAQGMYSDDVMTLIVMPMGVRYVYADGATELERRALGRGSGMSRTLQAQGYR